MDSAGTIKLRVLREEAILDYVVGPTASVNVLRKGDTKGDFRREPHDRGRGRPGHRAQPRWGGGPTSQGSSSFSGRGKNWSLL